MQTTIADGDSVHSHVPRVVVVRARVFRVDHNQHRHRAWADILFTKYCLQKVVAVQEIPGKRAILGHHQMQLTKKLKVLIFSDPIRSSSSQDAQEWTKGEEYGTVGITYLRSDYWSNEWRGRGNSREENNPWHGSLAIIDVLNDYSVPTEASIAIRGKNNKRHFS